MTWEELEKRLVSFYDLKPQLRDHVYQRSMESFAAGDRARDGIRTVEEMAERKAYIRAKLLEGLGGLPPLDTPLNPQVTGVEQREGFRLEKVVYTSRPHTYVTANLYVPDGVDAPRGAVLMAPGHSPGGKNSGNCQMVCQILAQAGLVVLIIDPLGQGERISYSEPVRQQAGMFRPTAEHDYVGVQCWPLGDGLARYFIHDLVRSIDYLCTRPEVDPTKIGMTGSSGGGTQTMLAMLCDDRIVAAAPGTFVTNREAKMLSGKKQDAEQIWPGMTAIGFDHEDGLMAIAPRPLLVLAATEDFFPIEGTRRTVERVRRFWKLHGQEENLELFEEETLHMYSLSMAKAAAEFFARHLLHKEIDTERLRVDVLDAPLLWCTKSGQVRTEYEDLRTVHEENADRSYELERERHAMEDEERRRLAREWLHQAVCADRRLCDLNPRYPETLNLDDEGLQVRPVLWRSQERLFNHALLIRAADSVEQKLPVTIALWEEGTSSLKSHQEWIRRECAGDRMVMVVDLTAVGPIRPHSVQGAADIHKTVHKLAMDLLWLNDSLAAIRTYDLLRALDMADRLKGSSPGDLRIYAWGKFSVYARLAAELDERARNLEVENGFGSFSAWVRTNYYDHSGVGELVLPGILRYMDIEEEKG